MNILYQVGVRPRGLLDRFLEKAESVVQSWGESPGNAHVYGPMLGWPRADLCERIASAMLIESGYHPDLLDALSDGEPPDGWSMSDLEAELERTRNRHDLVTDEWWEEHFG